MLRSHRQVEYGSLHRRGDSCVLRLTARLSCWSVAWGGLSGGMHTMRCSALGDFCRSVGLEYGSQKSCASSFPPRTESGLSRRWQSFNTRCHFDKRTEKRYETEKMLRSEQERGNGANICAFPRCPSVAMSKAGRCNETQPTAPFAPGAKSGEELIGMRVCRSDFW